VNSYLNAYGRQYIDDDDIAAVEKVLRGDFHTGGPTALELEREIAEELGVAFVSLCNSGTSALHLALLSLSVDSAWTVFVPAISFVATANAARMCGANVEFVDVDPDTGLMTPETLRCCVTNWIEHGGSGPVAVVPVHLAGQTVLLEEIYDEAKVYDAKVIIDACHAFGTTQKTVDGSYAVGDCRFADAEVFSFHPVKNIAMGEGGAVTTNTQEIAEKVKLLCSHGITKDSDKFESKFEQEGIPPWYYEMQELGFNYRITDIQAALGISQLKKLPLFKNKRAELVERYRVLLGNRVGSTIKTMPHVYGCEAMWHLMVVLIDFSKTVRTKTELMKALQKQGIGSQVHYIPIYQHPYYRKLKGFIRLPGAELYYSRTLSLPLHPNMKVRDVDLVVSALLKELEL
jgi:UDP-4-amino-4,6-dideoxy-N-acetyl-beta-L-altrosamine transaminase